MMECEILSGYALVATIAVIVLAVILLGKI